VAVEAIKAMPKPQIVSERLGRKNPGKARKGTRDVYWDGKFMSTEVYQWELLGHGNEAKGPAIVESVNTTLVVPPGQRLWVDEYKNVHMPL